ncbi:MAG: magnesium/cobalt transporter CorA [Candidatus Hydrogenedentota bacterium]|nr:MAG: magnesium/cobalt transporter CorA [Candidatus Hydrogenedentota bacterium]
MPKLIKRVSKKTGLPPGALVFVGEQKEEKARITVIDYDEKTYVEKDVDSVEDCYPFKDTQTVTWINVGGIHNIDILKKLGDCYGLHALVLEDILNTGQRPKIEDFENYLFVVLKMLYRDEKTNDIALEQVSIVLTQNVVISFQEREGDVFVPVRDRIKGSKGRIRRMGVDYLAYALLDAIVDHYFVVLEELGEKIESMEEGLVADPRPETLQAIYDMKREIIHLRKSVWPLREVVSSLERGEPQLIKDATQIYLRDLYDHTIQVIETIETFRDTVSGMLDIYLSSTSNRMNEVMKVLTIIATIFIPLGFVAGLYGMNFDNMPELHWRWGYLAALSVMILVGLSMLAYFKRKKWI